MLDKYDWLRDKSWPKVTDKKILDHLNQENDNVNNFFNNHSEHIDDLFNELKNRINVSDTSSYVKKDNYVYYTRTEKDKQYPIFCRKNIQNIKTITNEFVTEDLNLEEIILDQNLLAEGKKFCKIASVSISPNHRYLAYCIDEKGDEHYTIKVIDLKNNSYLEDKIKNVAGNLVWHEKILGFFYSSLNNSWQADKIKFHNLYSNIEDDKLIFHEEDNEFQVSVEKSPSKEYIFLNVSGHESNEYYFIHKDEVNFIPKLVAKRKSEFLYEVEHHEKYFYILSNKDSNNFSISRTKLDNTNIEDWKTYIPANEKFLNSFDITKNYLILNYRYEALPVIEIIRFNDMKKNSITNFVKFDEVYSASAFSTNFEEDDIRISYSSLTTPDIIFSKTFDDENLQILKKLNINHECNSEDYTVKRIWAKNGDVRVPITIFFKNNLLKLGHNPLYLTGYGSYGIKFPVSFRANILSLVDRGFIYAIAHIRGGSELGHDWYLNAKFLNKKNTFNDFIACSKELINKGYASQDKIAITGGSAGGLLIGYVINNNPELYKCAISHVPFVDVVNTMLDNSLPLTPGEYNEWGNPKDQKILDYMKSYSPYDNIKAINYPHVFATASIHDIRVGYWEAAKWIEKIRELKTNNNLTLLKTKMSSGHSGASGKFDYLKEIAEEYMFIMIMFGMI